MGILSSLERRSNSVRDPALAEFLGGGANTAAGMIVTPETAERLSAVYTCVRVLGETLASTPLQLYKRLPDGSKERATDHRLYKTITHRPNNFQTPFGFFDLGVRSMCLEGVAYSRIVIGNNGATTLWPLAANRVRADLGEDGQFRYIYSGPTGQSIPLRSDEVLRIPYATTDGIKPLSVIGVQRETLGAGLAAADYGSRYFANDATPKTYLKMPGRFADKDSRNAFRRDWQELQTGPNRGKTALLEDGMELGTLGVNNQDAQYLDTRKFQRSEIAGMFRVPLHLIGDLERSTNNNIEQQSLEFISYSMMPWFARWEQGLSAALLTEDEQEQYFFEFLIEGWLRGDSMARSQFYKDAIYAGWMNRNEVRVRENLNKADGLDDYIVPVNMTLADQLGQILGGGNGAGKTDNQG